MDVRQRRQPAGTPVGGQFAGRVGERSSVELSDSVVSQVFDATERAARAAARRYRDVEPDELRAATLVDLVAAARRDEAKVREWNRDPVEAEKYSTVMVRNLAWRLANPLDNSKQRAARKRLAAALAEYRSAHSGQNPPDAELADLAESVRLGIPARMRPGVDYWRWRNGSEAARRVSIDEECGDGRRNVGFGRDVAAPVADGVVAAVHDVLEDRDRAVRLMGRRKANGVWLRSTYRGVEALARARGDRLPSLVRIANKRAERSSKVVRDGGGVHVLCVRWQAGTTSESDDAALFAPWGQPGFQDQESVVAMLRDLGPERATVAWRSALANARTHPEDN